MYRDRKKKRNYAASSQAEEQQAWMIGCKGMLIAWLVTLVLLPAAAAIIYYGWINAGAIAIIAKVIMVVSMAIGGGYVFKKTKGKRRIWVLIMLIGYLAIRFLLSLILTFL